MASNPNPARITDAEWRFWQEVRQVIPGVRLGGIWVPKRCYHGDREYNQRYHPSAYCITLALDLRGPSDKSAAVDLTMSDAEMRARTRYLRNSAADPADDRLWALREFYGTLDSRSVYGLIKDDEDVSWRRSSADDTHLWHQHLSWLRAFVEQWAAFEPVLSVLSGETYVQWLARKEEDDMTPQEVWLTDGLLPIPRLAADGSARPDDEREANPHWQPSTYVRATYEVGARATRAARQARDAAREGAAAILAAVAGEDVAEAAAAAAQQAVRREFAALGPALAAELGEVPAERVEAALRRVLGSLDEDPADVDA